MSPAYLVKVMAMAAVLIAAVGCGSRQVMKPSSVVPRDCVTLAAPADVPDTITIALFDAPDPADAPVPLSAGETLVYRHLYETLIAVDCTGEVRGALAASWKRADGGRRWTIELREGARFWNGKPVTAWDVEWWWRTAMRRVSLRDARIDSISVVDEGSLELTFGSPHQTIPPVLSSPAFAVAAPPYGSEWPLGSGPFRPDDAWGGWTRRGLTVRPATGATVPVLRFVPSSARDARDLIDNQVDVLLTADPDVLDYAMSRRHLVTRALPWDRTYVLLSRTRVSHLRRGKNVPSFSSRLRDGLAADAVRNDARGCEPPFWWQGVDECESLSETVASLLTAPAGRGGNGTRRIVYPAGDPVARDLAQRIVALASEDPARSPEAAEVAAALPRPIGDTARVTSDGVAGNDFEWILRTGSAFGYILALPKRADPCYEARKLLRRAPWLATLGEALPEALIPLVDTRLHMIANGEKVGAAVDWYGRVLLYGWSREGDDLP